MYECTLYTRSVHVAIGIYSCAREFVCVNASSGWTGSFSSAFLLYCIFCIIVSSSTCTCCEILL